MITAELKQSEIVQLLRSYSFEDLNLTNADGKTYTYTYTSFSKAKLDKALGSHSIAGDGKVAVYEITNVGKLGVSPSNNKVRFIDKTKGSIKTDMRHLGHVEVTPALSKAFAQAAASPGLRVAYCTKLFEHLNKTKFQGKLPKLQFEVSSKSPSSKSARGVYMGAPMYGAGRIWMASFMFDAREPFFLEVFLHELCITGDSMVQTELGPIKMEDLGNSGAKSVMTRQGFSKILRWWKSGVKPTLSVKTATGKKLRLTENHPVLVKKWYGYRWVPAGKLRQGDMVLIAT